MRLSKIKHTRKLYAIHQVEYHYRKDAHNIMEKYQSPLIKKIDGNHLRISDIVHTKELLIWYLSMEKIFIMIFNRRFFKFIVLTRGTLSYRNHYRKNFPLTLNQWQFSRNSEKNRWGGVLQ